MPGWARAADGGYFVGPPDVLGVSYYGGAGNGYRHTDMQGTYDWMDKYARMMSPAAAVQFMECVCAAAAAAAASPPRVRLRVHGRCCRE